MTVAFITTQPIIIRRRTSCPGRNRQWWRRWRRPVLQASPTAPHCPDTPLVSLAVAAGPLDCLQQQLGCRTEARWSYQPPGERGETPPHLHHHHSRRPPPPRQIISLSVGGSLIDVGGQTAAPLTPSGPLGPGGGVRVLFFNPPLLQSPPTGIRCSMEGEGQQVRGL